MSVVFQFHLVRLKAYDARNFFGFNYEFQFHLVRLKEIPMQAARINPIFQFHLVRLKVFTHSPAWYVLAYFNSI